MLQCCQYKDEGSADKTQLRCYNKLTITSQQDGANKNQSHSANTDVSIEILTEE